MDSENNISYFLCPYFLGVAGQEITADSENNIGYFLCPYLPVRNLSTDSLAEDIIHIQTGY